tara:strand:+ start:788 stop:928 length:141 start_codon:yes stop_codon:yes gene_type:complete
MTEQKREFLQETAFEEDVDLDNPLKKEKEQRKVADKFAQWLEKENN